jgi:hypothetical protein
MIHKNGGIMKGRAFLFCLATKRRFLRAVKTFYHFQGGFSIEARRKKT